MPQQIRFSCVKVLMKDIVTPVPQEEVKTVIRKCLEQAALVNYTRLSEYAKIEGKALSLWNYNFVIFLGGNCGWELFERNSFTIYSLVNKIDVIMNHFCSVGFWSSKEWKLCKTFLFLDKREETVKRNCSFFFFSLFFFHLIVSAFGQWCSIQIHVVVLKNKLKNTWDVIFAAEGIAQLIACDSGVQETNEK